MLPNCYSDAYPLHMGLMYASWQVWLGVFVAVLALGVTVWALPRWWKIVPSAACAFVIWLGLHDYIADEAMIQNAIELVQAGNVGDPDSVFSAARTPHSIVARPVELGTACNQGLIVSVERKPKTEMWSIQRSYPRSPLQALRMKRLRDEFEADCIGRSEAMNPEMYSDSEIFKQLYSVCRLKSAGLEFYYDKEKVDRGFELLWCREIDDSHSYCEADGIAVAYAMGMQF